MDPLIELSDLIVHNPSQFKSKLQWICTRCPSSSSTRLTCSNLSSLLALVRFHSKSKERPSFSHSPIIHFLRSVPFRLNSYPQASTPDSILGFFVDFFGYLSVACSNSSDFKSKIENVIGELVVLAATLYSENGDELEISKIILNAVSRKWAPVGAEHAENVVNILIGGIRDEIMSSSEDGSASMSSNAKGKEVTGDASSNGNGTFSSSMENGSSCSVNFSGEESLEALFRMEIVFRLVGSIIDGGWMSVHILNLEDVRKVATIQLKSLPLFLKIRKHDLREQGSQLKARISSKLSCCQAAICVQVKSLLSLDSDSKTAKDSMRKTLALLLDAAESCLFSSWRKLRLCEELFSTLLNGIRQMTVSRGGQLLRVLLIHLKPLVNYTCAQADIMGDNQGAMFEAVVKLCCEIIEFGWSKERALVDTFIMGLAACIRERNECEEQDGKEKQAVPIVQLNLIRLLADLSVSVNKWEVVDMILPLFIESLEGGDAAVPSLLRLRLLDAVSRMASLGVEKSYRETIVLMTRSYVDKVKNVGLENNQTSSQEAITERVETLPAGFLLVASSLTSPKLRSDYRHRLLSLCSDVGLATESKSGSSGPSGAEFLGPLLPAVAEICSDFSPASNVELSLLKLFRNLWFYIVLFGLAPPIQQNQPQAKSISASLHSTGSTTSMALQAVAGPYMWSKNWSQSVQHIAHGTPPLVVSSVKWLEDELELKALHNPGSKRGSDNEKAAGSQRAALSAALGSRVEVAAMTSISGVKATFLLAVVFLESIRFSCNGGLLSAESTSGTPRSAFSCVFEYLTTPNLMNPVIQCLTATVLRAFETFVVWMEERITNTGKEADRRELILSTHVCFLIKNMSQRDEHVRDLSLNLLTQMKDKFPQVLWNFDCLDSLIFAVHNDIPSAQIHDPAVRSLYQKVVREWITTAFSHAPCTAQGLLQVIREHR